VLTARTELSDYVEAAAARRDEKYLCRACGAPVTYKPGRVRTAHFAHRPDASCAHGAAMSAAHLRAQDHLARSLRSRGLGVEMESPLIGAGGERRVDVLVWPADRPNKRVAIEVQASDLSVSSIEARTASYQAMGVAPLWLRLLDFSAFRTVQTMPFRGTIWIERYRARAWERWAHDHLGGRLWFMDAGTDRLWRGLFVGAHRGRERGAIYGGDNEVATRGADWTEAVQWVDLELDGPFDARDLRLMRGGAPGPDRRQRRFAWFVPEGEATAKAPFAPGVRVRFRRELRGESRDLQVRVGGTWISTPVEGARRDWRLQRLAARPVISPPFQR
jgi:hypothetical protein